MPALGTSLKVRNATQHIIYNGDLSWWSPYGLINNPLFTWVYDAGYSDWIATLTLKEFVALNRQQIQQLSGSAALNHALSIENLTDLIRSGAWDNATLEVTIYEWESGLDG